MIAGTSEVWPFSNCRRVLTIARSRQHRWPAQLNKATSAAAAERAQSMKLAPLICIIRRWGAVQSLERLSPRILNHSKSEGRCRFSGLVVPDRRTFRQTQLGTPLAGLALLAG